MQNPVQAGIPGRIGVFPHWFEDPLCVAIRGALLACVKAHGPITSGVKHLDSATKGVYGVLKALDSGRFDQERVAAGLGKEREQ